MNTRQIIKRGAIGLAGFSVLLLLFLWLALPGIIKTQAEKFVLEKTGHHLTLAKPEINPLALRLRLADLSLSDAQEQKLLSFDELVVDLSVASLPRRAMVFDAIRLAGLQVAVTELPENQLNWTPFLDALKSKDADEKPATGLPRLDIQQFDLTGGTIDFADQRRGEKSFSTRIAPLEISLKDIATVTDERGQLHLDATLSQGAKLALDAGLTLNPLNITGDIKLADFGLATLAPYLKEALAGTPAGAPDGTLSAQAHYQVHNGGQSLDAAIEQITLHLSGLRVPLDQTGKTQLTVADLALEGGRFELGSQQAGFNSLTLANTRLDLNGVKNSPQLAALSLSGASVDLGKRTAKLDAVLLKEGNIKLVRNAQGQIDLTDAVQALSAAQANKPAAASSTKSKSAPEATAAPWQYDVAKLNLDNWSLALSDQGISPAADLGLNALSVEVQGLSNKLDKSLPVQLSATFPKGGKVSLRGTATPAGPAADLTLNISDLALSPLQAYLASRTTLKLVSGKLATQGRLTYGGAGKKAAPGPGFTGSFDVRDLRIDEEAGKTTLLAWRRFGTNKLTATAQQLDIGELRLSGLDTTLIIDKDKTSNVSRVMKPASTPEAATSTPPPANVGTKTSTTPSASAPFVTNIARLRIDDGELEFADKSLVLPFGTRIHGLHGSISGLSSRPGRPGQLELDGEVDDFGQARAAGQVDMFNPTGFMDLRVIFRNVDMPRLSAYTATFAGRKIESGKLSLDLQYKIKERQLQGDNKVIIDRLTLGERVESPSAKDLPLNLAIAILEDSNGRIDLGLPVSGNLDDPQFSYGAIVWKAITNVLSKIVTAPFRALGALFGSEEKLDSIVFEAGSAVLTPPEREKLVRVSSALAKRQNLNLAVRGIYTAEDRIALQDQQLRRTLMSMSGEAVPADAEPGPVSTSEPKIQSALESLYGKRTSGSDLAALKDGFRQANPGQLEESTTGKMMSRLTGLMREKKTLSESEISRLKGADFYSVLYEKVRATEELGEDRLKALAKARGDYAHAELLRYGAATARTSLLPPEKGDSSEAGIPLKLELAPGKGG